MSVLGRTFLALALGLLPACWSALADGMDAASDNAVRRVDSVTEFFGFGGIHIATNRTSVELGPDAYAVAADTRSSGLAALLIDLETHSEVSGSIVQGRLRPRLYRGQVHRSGTDSDATVEHRDDGSVSAAAHPPAVSLHVDPATIARTTDQMTAFLSVERQVAAGRPCTADLSVFDGRHLYTLHFRPMAAEPMEGAHAAGFGGPIRVCHMVREVMSGFADPAGRGEGVSEAVISYGLLGDGLAIPLRMQLQTEFGPVTARLVELRVNGVRWPVPG